ncbi:DNA-binding protein [Paraburkholderia sp. BR10954]|uniref:DNA-binding protein n=1 Tax=Paraburkholderia sp. BR10954 TaxID=3236995 RepID=UPI0034D1B982
MPRPAAATRDDIRATVLAMLAEAGDPEPPSGARFRQVVSVRKLRARLGAGDPTTLSRMLNGIEAEVVRAGLTGVAIPGLPDPIAEQMRALWQAAVTVQLTEVVALKNDAAEAKEAAAAATRDASLRVELLRVELAALRDQISRRDSELATVRAEWRATSEQMKASEATALALQETLASTNAAIETARSDHASAIAAVHARYEGLSRQLLQETEHQRHALQIERERLTEQVAEKHERVSALEGLRDRLLADLAAERDARLRAAAEVAALTTLVAEQRALLATLDRRAHAAASSPHRKPASTSPTPTTTRRRRPK